jgi:hypothetical protein
MMANAAIAIHEVKPEVAEVAPDDARPNEGDGEFPTLETLPNPPAHHEVSEKETIRDENVKKEQEQKEAQMREEEQ